MLTRLQNLLEFLLFYSREVVMSNFRVAWDVLTPPLYADPDFIELALDPNLTDVQIMMVANLITMTPGTLSIDVSPDRKTLLIHAMYADDRENLVASLKNDFERRVRNVF